MRKPLFIVMALLRPRCQVMSPNSDSSPVSRVFPSSKPAGYARPHRFRYGGEGDAEAADRSVRFAHLNVEIAAIARRIEVCNFKRSRSDRCLVDFLTILTDGYFGVSDGNATNNRSVAALRIRQHPVICSKAEAAVVQTGKETTCRDQLARRELAAIFG